MNCSLCGATKGLSACCDGYICDPCAERGRQGKDATTQKAKLLQRALKAKSSNAVTAATGGTVSDAESFAAESAVLLALDDTPANLTVTHGEALPASDMRDTMATPGIVAADASAERLALVSQLGVDCAAMALDASDTIKASNSLEKLAAHQMALLHTTAMNYAHKAAMHPDTQTQVKLMNISIRAIETFQRGLLIIKRLRSSGDQKIVVQHVNIEAGGQAIVGHIEPKGML